MTSRRQPAHRSPVVRLRVKFFSFAALTVAGIVIGAPVWSIVASLFLCVAIPLAVAVQGTESVRVLFLPSRGAAEVPFDRKAVRHAQVR